MMMHKIINCHAKCMAKHNLHGVLDGKFENAGRNAMQMHGETHGNFAEMQGEMPCNHKSYCFVIFPLISLIFLVFYLRLYNNDMCGFFYTKMHG